MRIPDIDYEKAINLEKKGLSAITFECSECGHTDWLNPRHLSLRKVYAAWTCDVCSQKLAIPMYKTICEM